MSVRGSVGSANEFVRFGRGGFYLVLGALAYLGLLQFLGGLRSEHLLIVGLILGLYTAHPLSRFLLRLLLPFVLTGVVYDSMRYYADWIRGPIHVREPYEFDLRFFGISTGEGRLTPNEYFDRFHWAWVDLVTGFAYLVFIGEYIGMSLLSFWPLKQVRLTASLAWSFFVVNVVGYSTYYWYAAAPPWYVKLYGLGPANMEARPNPAACLRFDEILGTHFFTQMYGRSADVFGAVPSLHVAYPLLAFLYSFEFQLPRRWMKQALILGSFAFWIHMQFSAVYLQHHYILDILWGDSYAVLTYLFEKGVLRHTLLSNISKDFSNLFKPSSRSSSERLSAG